MEEFTPEVLGSIDATAAVEPTEALKQAVKSPAAALPADAAIEDAPEKEAAGKDATAKPNKAKASPLVKEAQVYVTELLNKELSTKLTYHSLRHTEAVVKECRALAPAANLSSDDTEALLLAAWFHDVGYLDVYDGHEFRSMERATAWLTEHQVLPGRVQLIKDLIRATHRDSICENDLQKLLVDADMSNLARDDFRSSAELLRIEWELMLGKSYSNPDWAELQLNFMLGHKYESEAGKDRYRKPFKKNLDEQRDQLKKT